MKLLLRLPAVLATTAALVVAVLAQPGSAELAPHGSFLVKGPGSTYSIAGVTSGPAPTATPATAVVAVARGKVAQFNLQVFNSGFVATTYRIALSVRHDDASQLASTPTVSTTGLFAKALPLGPDGYLTPSIGIGKTVTFAVKVPTSATGPAGHVYLDATLTTPDGVVQDHALMITEQQAPAKGTTATDITAKQGSQQYVGSPGYEAVAGAPAVTSSQATTFTVRVQNNGATASAIRLRATAVNTPCVSMTVKQGLTNVTSAAVAGTLSSGTLAKGGSKTYTVSIVRVFGNRCAPNTVRFTASSPSSADPHSVLLLVPFGN